MTSLPSSLSTDKKLVGCTSVGTAPPSKIEVVRFQIHGFEGRCEPRGTQIETPILYAHGFPWSLSVYPRGSNSSSTEKEMVSVYLNYQDSANRQPTVTYTFGFGSKLSKSLTYTFTKRGRGHGLPGFRAREALCKALDKGTLTIDVQIEVQNSTHNVWFPHDCFDSGPQYYKITASHVLAPFDVQFYAGPKSYKAHRSIVEMKAPALLAFGNPVTAHRTASSTTIQGISSATLSKMLDFIYEMEIPKIPDLKTATILLETANKFECTSLKLYVESVIVESFLDPSTAAQLLVFADSQTCALLQEGAMKVYEENPTEVMESEGWTDVAESPRLLQEILRHTVLTKQHPSEKPKLCEMDVGSLRNLLQDHWMELDGTREMLVKRLEPMYESAEKEDEEDADENEDEN